MGWEAPRLGLAGGFRLVPRQPARPGCPETGGFCYEAAVIHSATMRITNACQRRT
jgi:hypothetical protein